jgi:hypothetical protein
MFLSVRISIFINTERITHFSVHFSDENGDKGGDKDIHCMIEARPSGLKPVAVHHLK